MKNSRAKNPTTPISIRCTEEQKQELIRRAYALGMPYTSYAVDKLFNGKERKKYANRILCTSLIKTGENIDSLLNRVSQTETDSISKQELIDALNNIRKELNIACFL